MTSMSQPGKGYVHTPSVLLDSAIPERVDLCGRCALAVLRPLQGHFYCWKCGYKGDESVVFVRERKANVLEVPPNDYRGEYNVIRGLP